MANQPGDPPTACVAVPGGLTVSLMDADDSFTAGAPSHVALGGVNVAATSHCPCPAEEEQPVRQRLAIFQLSIDSDILQRQQCYTSFVTH